MLGIIAAHNSINIAYIIVLYTHEILQRTVVLLIVVLTIFYSFLLSVLLHAM